MNHSLAHLFRFGLKLSTGRLTLCFELEAGSLSRNLSRVKALFISTLWISFVVYFAYYRNLCSYRKLHKPPAKGMASNPGKFGTFVFLWLVNVILRRRVWCGRLSCELWNCHTNRMNAIYFLKAYSKSHNKCNIPWIVEHLKISLASYNMKLLIS